MRIRSCSLGLLGGAVAAVVTVGWAAPIPTLVELLGTTALIMGGTEHPLVTPDGGQIAEDPTWVTEYVYDIQDGYLVPTWEQRGDDGDYTMVAVYTPEEFFPVYGKMRFNKSIAVGYDNLKDCMASCSSYTFPPVPAAPNDAWVYVGYSQSATIASMEKQRLIDTYRHDGVWDDDVPQASFLMLANPNRPNGGVLMRFHGITLPLLGVTMNGATATDSCDGEVCHFPTVDVVYQYDFFGGDFPTYPLNLLALANSLLSYVMNHGDIPEKHFADAVQQGDPVGDTSYYMIGADVVPLLQPLLKIGIPKPLLLVFDAPLRVMIEAAYRRDISPGTPTPAYLIPVNNPVKLVVNLLRSIPVGWDNAIEEITGRRPFGTTKPDMYGVGGHDDNLKGLPAGLIPLGRPDTAGTVEALAVSVESTSAFRAIEGKRQRFERAQPVQQGAAVQPTLDGQAPPASNPEVDENISLATESADPVRKARPNWRDWRSLRAQAKSETKAADHQNASPRPKSIIKRFAYRLNHRSQKSADAGGATPAPSSPPKPDEE